MSKKSVSLAMMGVSAVLLAITGCAVDEPTNGDVPAIDVDAVEEAQLLTSGAWTADAHAPNGGMVSEGEPVYGSATFTGPAGNTRRLGVCILKQKKSGGNPIPCSTASTCPATPTGGFRYCTAPNGVGQKTCFERSGPPSTYCAGTPANGGAAVSAGTYYTPSVPASTGIWISYACFEGCASTDPSSSSVGLYQPGSGGNCGAYAC